MFQEYFQILSDAALTALKKLGVTKVSIQLGSGEFEAKRFEEVSEYALACSKKKLFKLCFS